MTKEGIKKLDEDSKNLYFYEATQSNYDPEKFEDPKKQEQNLNWNFNPKIKEFDEKGLKKEETPIGLSRLENYTLGDLQDVDTGAKNMERELYSLRLPLYLITTRDSFAYDLIEKKTIMEMNGKKVLKTGKISPLFLNIEFFFDPNSYPANFKTFKQKFPDYRVGITTYNNFFSLEELTSIEDSCYETERKFFSSMN
jgi:hypothetical protein